MADAKRVNEPVEPDLPARLDRAEQVAHRGFAITFILFEPDLTIALRQRENLGRLLDPALFEKELDLLVAEAFDVEGAA
jgi:hypothetical protein